MSHTPGPWTFDSNVSVIRSKGFPHDSTRAGGEFQGAECSNEICTVKRIRVYEFWMSGSREHYPIKPEVRSFFREQYLANAHLIEAAPELLEALRAFISLPHLADDVCDECAGCKVCDAVALGKAAIAKAGGREP